MFNKLLPFLFHPVEHFPHFLLDPHHHLLRHQLLMPLHHVLSHLHHVLSHLLHHHHEDQEPLVWSPDLNSVAAWIECLLAMTGVLPHHLVWSPDIGLNLNIISVTQGWNRLYNSWLQILHDLFFISIKVYYTLTLDNSEEIELKTNFQVHFSLLNV